MSKLDNPIESCRRQQAALLPHDGYVEEDESDAGDDDVQEAVQEEDVQARVDVRVSEAALMEYLVAVCVKCTVTEFYWQRYEILYRRHGHNIATLWVTLSTWEEEIRTLFCKEHSIHSANTPFLFYFVPIALTILRTQFN